MPSCSGTEFEVIEQYLRIRGWIDEDDSYGSVVPDQKTPGSEDYSLRADLKLPQFSSSFLCAGRGSDQQDPASPSLINTMAAPWEGCGGVAGGGAAGLNALGGEPLPPTNFLLTDHDPFPSTTPTPISLSTTSSPPFLPSTSRTYVAGKALTGCTVIEASFTSTTTASPSPGGAERVPFGEDPQASLDIYDMDSDKYAFYKDGSGYGGNRGNGTGTGCAPSSPYGQIPESAIKTEQPAGCSLYDLQPSCGLGGRGGGMDTQQQQHHQQQRGMLGGGPAAPGSHLPPHHLMSLDGGIGGLMGREEREDLSSFMIHSLREEIVEECKRLHLSLDPENWTPGDTMKWMSNVLKKEQAMGVNGDNHGALHCPTLSSTSSPLSSHPPPEFLVSGETLCRMTLADFQRLSPYHGAMLHQKLEIWRIAMDITSELPIQTDPQWYHHPAGSQHHHHHSHNHQPHPNHHHHHHHQPQYHSLTPTSQYGSNSNIAHSVAAGAGTGTPGPMTIGDLHNNHNHHHQYGGGSAPQAPPHHLPLCISPAPSTESNCSSMSAHSSSSLLSLGGRGGVGGSHHTSAGVFAAGGAVTSHGLLRLEDEVFESASDSRRTVSQLTANSHRHHRPAHQLPSSTTTTTTTATPISTSAPPRVPRAGKQTIHLWQFLRELLDNADSYHDCIKWTDRARGIFKIEDSSKVARLWGRRKNRPAMNYDKLSRSVRQYYKKGIIKKTEHSKRLVYQFCQPYL